VLSDVQQRVAQLVGQLPEAAEFALAGGAALVLAEVVERQTRDLDYFGPTADAVGTLAHAIEMALTVRGLDVRRERSNTGFVRLIVSDGGDTTELDIAVDARIRPVETGPFGPTLALEELAADKLLALFDRAQARDFIDVEALVRRFGLDRLCALAAEKDRGFSRSGLVEALGTFDRFTATDLGTDEPGRQRLATAVRQWERQLTPLRAPPPSTGGPDSGHSL
jgi:hypothetical protein